MQHKIKELIELMDFNSISEERKGILHGLALAIRKQLDNRKEANLTFICTHNSRRSQMAQVWASFAACHYSLSVKSFSGGTEATATALQVLNTFDTFGFKVDKSSTLNGKHSVTFNEKNSAITLRSKLYNDPANPDRNFIAVMTCSDADENCPLVIGCDQRVALTYNDPKKFDDSLIERTMYEYVSFKIGTEIMYAFSLLKSL